MKKPQKEQHQVNANAQREAKEVVSTIVQALTEKARDKDLKIVISIKGLVVSFDGPVEKVLDTK